MTLNPGRLALFNDRTQTLAPRPLPRSVVPLPGTPRPTTRCSARTGLASDWATIARRAAAFPHTTLDPVRRPRQPAPPAPRRPVARPRPAARGPLHRPGHHRHPPRAHRRRRQAAGRLPRQARPTRAPRRRPRRRSGPRAGLRGAHRLGDRLPQRTTPRPPRTAVRRPRHHRARPPRRRPRPPGRRTRRRYRIRDVGLYLARNSVLVTWPRFAAALLDGRGVDHSAVEFRHLAARIITAETGQPTPQGPISRTALT